MPDSANQNPGPDNPSPPSQPAGRLNYREAFARALPDAMALAASELVTINIDIPTALTVVLGKLRHLVPFRARIVVELPRFDIRQLDQLETYALATGHAHALYLAASAAPDALARLTAEGTALRDTLYSDAVALTNRRLISGARLREFRLVPGYKSLAFDLLGLVALLRLNWDRIAGRTALQSSELDAAELLGERLLETVGARERTPAALADVSQQRQRMFTLFVNAYAGVRRAIAYLRSNEDDLDSIAPSLYAGRRTRRKPEPVTAPAPAGDEVPSSETMAEVPSHGVTSESVRASPTTPTEPLDGSPFRK